MKVLLILADGMRPDSLTNLPAAKRMMGKAAYTMKGTTVMPSVTLPCHMSLFHSVEPGRHGTTSNTYMPQVRPIAGLCDVLNKNGKKCGFFYDWEELRDLAKPGSLDISRFYRGGTRGYAKTAQRLTDDAIDYIREDDPDFTFLYLCYPDGAGHKEGFMSEPYMEAVRFCWEQIERITDTLTEDYVVFITADHGGHDRSHGADIPEDMTIPLFILGQGFAPGSDIGNANIMDIAPTVAEILGITPDAEWEGKSLL